MPNNGFLFSVLAAKIEAAIRKTECTVVNGTVSERALTNMKRNFEIFLQVKLPFRANRNECRHSESVS